MASSDLPLCMICSEHPVATKRGVVCHSPRCKRKLAEERQRMAASERKKKTDAKRERAREDLVRPEKLKREIAQDFEKALSYGYTRTEAVWVLSRQYGLKPAEVLHVAQTVSDPKS